MAGISICGNAATGADVGAILYMGRTRASSNGGTNVVSQNDLIGRISFQGADGSELIEAAAIRVDVDGTPGANDMPGRIEFHTTADGSPGATERMRIDSSGRVLIGTPNAVAFGSRQVLAVTNGTTGGVLSLYNSTTATANTRISSNPTGSEINDIGIHAASTNGSIQFYTNNDTERMRIDSSGNVGVGTTPQRHLHVHESNSATVGFMLTNAATGAANDSQGFQLKVGSDTHAEVAQMENSNLRFLTNANERMRIDSAGQVGIGNSDPGTLLHVSDSSDDGAVRVGGNTAGSTGLTLSYSNSGNTTTTIMQNYRQTSGNALLDIDTGTFTVSTGTSGTERMRIDSSGNVVINDTSVIGNGKLSLLFHGSSGNGLVIHNSWSGNDASYVVFRNYQGSTVGQISATQTATTYGTSSDYRLKENVVDLDGAIDRVKQLAPKRFNFIVDADKTVDGFLAHEAQTVVPEAVTGEKDGEKMQGIDQSKLVPLLTAALKEAITKIETLEAKVAALEAE